jgi:hypothetical protein
LIHEGEGLDLFPLHAFTDILQWREERYEFEGLGEVAPQIYFRLSDQGYLECIPFSNKAVFSHLGKDAYKRFCDIFRLQEWLEQQRRRKEAQEIQKLWDELARELTEIFVGRDKHIKQVKDAIKGKRKGILWISGKPGVGKSTLMAKLMRDYIDKTQHYIVIPYFFHIGKAGCSTMEFLATALKRLQVELNRTIELEHRLPERQKQLMEALEEAVSKTGKKVLFLVDGLDEIYRLEREFLNVLFMTMAVEDRIVWVCAGRSEGDLEEALRSRGAVWVFPYGLPPLDEQAIREMLTVHLGHLKYELFKRDEGERNRFVEAVTCKSEGLPLYVRMVIEDLKAGRLTVWDEDKLPEGLVAYYERLLERLRVSDVGTVLTPLFCLLAWVKDPINEGTMNFLLQTHDLAGSDEWDELFQEVLEHGHLMLQQRPTPDGETGWTIYHDSFRQHLLQSRKVSRYRKWAQKRWLEVCEDWKALASQEPSLHRYILRHYADHLYERWQSPVPDAQSFYSVLCQLALDPDFAQAQTEHLPDEPNLPLKTVQRALEVAIKSEDALMMVKLLMEHAKRAQSEEETPLQAWRKGHRERALKMTMEIAFERDHKLGTLWGLLLAWEAESEGEREWARRCLDEIRKRWEGANMAELKDWQGEMAVFLLSELGQVEGAIEVAGLVLDDGRKRELATSWASKELFDQALKMAEGIEDKGKRAGALMEIAEGMAKAGMFDQALKVVERIEDAREQAVALGATAGGMAKVGMEERAKEVFDQALKAAIIIKETNQRARAFVAIAIEIAKLGKEKRTEEVFGQALQMAEQIEEPWEWVQALMEIAEGMARAGMFDQALKVAEGIEYARDRARALRVIAEAIAKAGMFDQALKVAERIEEADEQVQALMEIAEGMARAGMFDQALKVAEGIEYARDRARALRAIAEAIAKAGMFDQALKVAERIEEADEQVQALMEIAEGMAKARMEKKAKEVFEQSLQIAEGIEDIVKRAWTLGEIAKRIAKAGMEVRAREIFHHALQVIEGIEPTELQALPLWEIARMMATAGMTEWAEKVFEQALQIVKVVEDEYTRARELTWITKAMAESKIKKGILWQQTLRVAEGLKSELERAEELQVIAEGMAKVGVQDETLWQQALQIAEGIKDMREGTVITTGLRAKAVVPIIEAMAKVGLFEKALEVTEKIKETRLRESALWEIMRAMLEARFFEQALKVAEKIEEASSWSWALWKIAVAMAQIRLFDQALKVIEEIGIEMLRASATHSVISRMAEVGQFDRALKLAEETEWGEWTSMQASALNTIAKAIAKVGKFDKALQVAGKIERSNERMEALIAITKGMVKAEMFDQALELVERIKIEGALWWARALVAIAEEIVRVGMEERQKEIFYQALQVAEGIKEAEYRAEILGEIAEGMARAGMFDQALKATKGINEARERADVLVVISVEMARVGMREQAMEVFDQALKVVEGIEWEGERAKTLRKIAGEMARVGMVEWAKEVFDQALKVVEGIEWEGKRAEALGEIVEEMARAGEVEGVVSIIEREMAVRMEGLPSVLEALVERARKGDEKSKGGFLRLLPLCGWSLKLAYKACGWLVWLYPEQVVRIAEEIMERNLSE